VLALSLVPLFLNGFLTHALIAAERARLLPRLTGLRVVLAGLFAGVLVPAAGGPGAALGFASSELVLVALGARAARGAGFPVRIARPTLLALAASLPMAAAVWPVRHDLLQAILVGVLAQSATLAVLARSRRLRRELGYS
jgi:O-antigen/teichoic acid export membrane protein